MRGAERLGGRGALSDNKVVLIDPACLEIFDSQWPSVLAELAPRMHPVDRDACFIWFQFFPLELFRLLQSSEDGEVLAQFFQLKGTYSLSELANTSHWFLYGHRYWKSVRDSLRRTSPDESLARLIESVAAATGELLALSLPIAAIGLMTLRQAGAAFLDSGYDPPAEARSPDDIVKSRQRERGRRWWPGNGLRVVLDERDAQGWFSLIKGQHITTAAERDKRPYHLTNPRCSPSNGPIPVDCRSGSCGTCWVGILGGREKIAPPDEFERKRMAYFGYWESPFHAANDPSPLIRLACQTKVTADCTIVIPSWNGVWSVARRAAFARRAESSQA